jgi:hypothetical protein
MTSVCLPNPFKNEIFLRLQLAELRESLTGVPYTSSAVVEIMPTKLIAKTCLFWVIPKCCLSSHVFQGLL